MRVAYGALEVPASGVWCSSQISSLVTEIARSSRDSIRSRMQGGTRSSRVGGRRRVPERSSSWTRFPALAARARELPSLLQERIDRHSARRLHVVISGSSQRMMQGLVLERTSPLFGRAQAILKIEPLRTGWIAEALDLRDGLAVESYAVWGGMPRYWELAADLADLGTALRSGAEPTGRAP